jgi:hypothetical protein
MQGFVTDQRFSSFSIPPCKLLLKSAVAGIKNPRLLSLARVIPILAEFIKRPQAVKSALSESLSNVPSM